MSRVGLFCVMAEGAPAWLVLTCLAGSGLYQLIALYHSELCVGEAEYLQLGVQADRMVSIFHFAFCRFCIRNAPDNN